MELRELLHELTPGVHVVSLMSQRFSGAFAALSAPSPTVSPVCGYFSSTPDRPAYGCFPENVGKERVGHSFHFIRALAASRRMTDAHEEVLLADDTPDVPLRSSDVFLSTLLGKIASERSVRVEAVADDLLGASWRDVPSGKPSARSSIASPRPSASVHPRRWPIPRSAVRRAGRARAAARRLFGGWKAALSDATGDNLQSFVAANPVWTPRLSDTALQTLAGNAARDLTAALLGELVPWTRKDKGDRLDTLEHRGNLASEASYRTEVASRPPSACASS